MRPLSRSMTTLLRPLLERSFLRQLVLGIAAVHAVLMTVFVGDLVARQRELLASDLAERGTGLAQMTAVNSVSWVLADDIMGLAEVIGSIRVYPEVLYAMVLDEQGRVLGHTDHSKLGLFVTDEVSRSLLSGQTEVKRTVNTAMMVEVAAPILSGGHLVGWARVAMDGRHQASSLREVLRDGIIYTIGAIIAGTVFAFWMARWLTSHLRRLAASADRLRSGEREIQPLPTPPLEIAALEVAFLAMAETTWQREDELRHSVEQLTASNADLEQFAYVASHDLQTPLREMTSYAQLLSRRYQGRLDADADDFIGFIVDGAKRMTHLIQDLLDYARITSQGIQLEAVPAERALGKALGGLRQMLDMAAVEMVVPDLPVVLADEIQLTSLFQNLIENAVKYRHPERSARITISASRASTAMWQISVADNGIGIEPQYFHKVFVIFQRLYPANDTEGTGIGLALCQRIVRRFGGRIWVDSTPGQGSTFHFTIRDGAAEAGAMARDETGVPQARSVAPPPGGA